MSTLPKAIPRAIVPSIQAKPMNETSVKREFRLLLENANVSFVRLAKSESRPDRFLSKGYYPKYKITLFNTVYYLTNVRKEDQERFLVAYVVPDADRRGKRCVYVRLFYKDYSLVWRVASHYHGRKGGASTWFGKGDICDEGDYYVTVESTTDLPLEICSALDEISMKTRQLRTDRKAVSRVVRWARSDQLAAYEDFLKPRTEAKRNQANNVNHQEPVAYLDVPGDPMTHRFVPGFEPDFKRGIISIHTDCGQLTDLYGGEVIKYRVLSRNRQIQFLAAYARSSGIKWIVPPQSITTHLTSYGVRTVDVNADKTVFLAGVEYFGDEDEELPTQYYRSQIPAGYAGKKNEIIENLADCSQWLNDLHVIKEFDRHVVRQHVSKPNYSKR